MSFRNLSPQEMFIRTALEHKPVYAFNGKSKKNFSEWKKEALPKVMATLGDFPDAVPLNPMLLAEWEHDGLTKQKWIIDVQKHISATFLINIPRVTKKTAKLPAILCCHGHGPHGKEPVMGNDSTAELKGIIKEHNYDYGHQMAKKGFVTFAIDWIGFGERNDSQKPNGYRQNGSRDWCNIYYLHATILGMTSLSINITHGKAAVSFASTFPFVDKNRIGVMGLSGGGTMTLWMYLCDERLKAAEIICYSDLWAHFGIRDLNYCGMQIAPGLYKLVDLPDLQGLCAPRPLLIDIGAYDACFKIDTAKACYDKLSKIYQTADASENLELDLHKGQHGWGGNKAEKFFSRHLK